MWVDKERVREYYRKLKDEFPDLCHEDSEYVKVWVEKAKNLRIVGAWYHYMVLIRKAKEYVRKNCPCYEERLNAILKRFSSASSRSANTPKKL